MAFCKNCGNEIEDNAQFCGKCGAAQNSNAPVNGAKKESSALGIVAIVFACLGGLVGLVLSIVSLCVYKQGSPNRKLGWIAFGICMAWIAIAVVVSIVYAALGIDISRFYGGM